MEKLLPQNIEAEASVLGSILIEPACYDLVADQLVSEDFYRVAHRLIYEAMASLAERRITPDFVTVCDELERCNRLEDAGGMAYVDRLVYGVPTSNNVEHYAQIVTRTAGLRRLIHAASQVAAIAYGQEEHAEEAAERAILDAIGNRRGRRDFSTAAQVASACYDDLTLLREHSFVGVPTGFASLDHMTGGLQPSDLIVLAGRPGMGKSSMMLSLVYNMLRSPQPARVALFSLEMSEKQLMQRLISYESHVDLYRLRNAYIADDEWQPLTDAHASLSKMSLFIDDTGGITLTELRSKARRLQATSGLDAIAIDYMQLIHNDRQKEANRNREQEVAEISRGLKELAKELNVPVLALAQLSRAVEGRQEKRPQLSDLRESGSIENDADIVMFLYREGYYQTEQNKRAGADPSRTELIVAKHRNGPVGSVDLRFVASETRFVELEATA